MNFNLKNLVAKLMGIFFYVILVIIIVGFVIKFAYNQESVNILKGVTAKDIFTGIINLDSNAFFSLAVYISALSPIIFSSILFLGYILQYNIKGVLLTLGLILSLSLSLFIKF